MSVYNPPSCAYLCQFRFFVSRLSPYSPSRPPTSMVRLNPSGSAAPAPPEGFMEYLTLLSQNPTLFSSLQPPSLSALQPPSLPTPSIVPPPPPQGRSFSRPNRGTGGALVEKQKISKEITASATKRKSPLDPDIELISEVTESSTRQAKRPRPTKVSPHF